MFSKPTCFLFPLSSKGFFFFFLVKKISSLGPPSQTSKSSPKIISFKWPWAVLLVGLSSWPLWKNDHQQRPMCPPSSLLLHTAGYVEPLSLIFLVKEPKIKDSLFQIVLKESPLIRDVTVYKTLNAYIIFWPIDIEQIL